MPLSEAAATPVSTLNPRIDRVSARAYRIPTDPPESDGTLAWNATVVIIVEVAAGPVHGLGWTYADVGCVPLINDKLAGVIVGRPLLDVPATWMIMQQQLRNLGRPGWHRAGASRRWCERHARRVEPTMSAGAVHFF